MPNSMGEERDPADTQSQLLGSLVRARLGASASSAPPPMLLANSAAGGSATGQAGPMTGPPGGTTFQWGTDVGAGGRGGGTTFYDQSGNFQSFERENDAADFGGGGGGAAPAGPAPVTFPTSQFKGGVVPPQFQSIVGGGGAAAPVAAAPPAPPAVPQPGGVTPLPGGSVAAGGGYPAPGGGGQGGLSQYQAILDLLAKEEATARADTEKQGTTMDPATQFQLDELRRGLERNTETSNEDLNRRGIYSSGIAADVLQKLKGTEGQAESGLLASRYKELQNALQQRLGQIGGERFQVGLAGAQAQTSAEAAQRSEAFTRQQQDRQFAYDAQKVAAEAKNRLAELDQAERAAAQQGDLNRANQLQLELIKARVQAANASQSEAAAMERLRVSEAAAAGRQATSEAGANARNAATIAGENARAEAGRMNARSPYLVEQAKSDLQGSPNAEAALEWAQRVLSGHLNPLDYQEVTNWIGQHFGGIGGAQGSIRRE